jgi:hypothetical protein
VTPEVTFTALDVEEDYDFVHVYDGASASSAQLAEISGELDDLATKQYRGSGLSLTVTFNSDESEGGAGFVFEYACGAAKGALRQGAVLSFCTFISHHHGDF